VCSAVALASLAKPATIAPKPASRQIRLFYSSAKRAGPCLTGQRYSCDQTIGTPESQRRPNRDRKPAKMRGRKVKTSKHRDASNSMMRAHTKPDVTMDVVIWLRSLGLGKYEAIFHENDINECLHNGADGERAASRTC
jgi:hypothetical protein